MKLSIEERNSVVLYRVEKSKKTLKEIEELIPLCQWNTIANRLYYCAYYMVSALLIKNGYLSHTHAGVKTLFALHFIKTGILPNDAFHFYMTLFDYRLKGDYDDFFDLNEKQILPLIEPIKEFIIEMEKLISEDIK